MYDQMDCINCINEDIQNASRCVGNNHFTITMVPIENRKTSQNKVITTICAQMLLVLY